MESIGIDLKELVLKASKHGAQLVLRFERDGSVILSAYRGGFVIDQSVSPWGIYKSMWLQGDLFNRTVDEMMRRLNEAEEKLIENGGFGK